MIKCSVYYAVIVIIYDFTLSRIFGLTHALNCLRLLFVPSSDSDSSYGLYSQVSASNDWNWNACNEVMYLDQRQKNDLQLVPSVE